MNALSRLYSLRQNSMRRQLLEGHPFSRAVKPFIFVITTGFRDCVATTN
jgi:hypothetical protein